MGCSYPSERTRAGAAPPRPPQRRAWSYAQARLVQALRLLQDGRRWSEFATRWQDRGRVHQDNSLTWSDRYPVLFDATRTLMKGRDKPKLLSYGCSSGQEVSTLRRYFPSATVVGVEINRHLLRTCRRLSADDAVVFVAPHDPALTAHGPYDAIFCMAVLTRRPHEVERSGRRDIADFYPYRLFAGEVRRLAALLAPGGLLVVEHALYRVEDAIDDLGLSSVTSHGVWPAKGPRFGPDGTIIEPQPLIARIFCKCQA